MSALNQFARRHALVTGGAGSIGSATTLRLLAEGAEVTVWDRSAEALHVLQEQAVSAQERLRTRVVDLAQAEAITQAAEALSDDAPVDILINNVGGAFDKPYSLLEQTDDDWQMTFNVNLMSAVRVSRVVVPGMAKHRYGRIVNVGSKAGRYGSYIDGPSYVAAKGALHALTMQLAMEFGRDGITANAVAPGMVLVERVRRLWETRRPADEREAILNAIPLRRHATADDVAGVVVFLASDDAAFVTGTVIDVNGGQSMQA